MLLKGEEVPGILIEAFLATRHEWPCGKCTPAAIVTASQLTSGWIRIILCKSIALNNICLWY